MGRLLSIALFAVAAGAAVAAGNGVVVAAHVDPPNTPLFHTHPFAAYRLAILDAGHTGYEASETLIARAETSAVASMVVLALLASRPPGICRPTLRAVAQLRSPRIVPRQWRMADPFGPPRSTVA